MTTIIKKVRCIDTNGAKKLTYGQIYEVKYENGSFYDLVGDKLNGYWRTRFEDVIEPDFKVGDKVVFARESKGDLKTWNFVFEIGKAYTVEEIGGTGNILANNGYYMDKECFDLAPEPKPERKSKFKVGDTVKVIALVTFSDKPYLNQAAKVVRAQSTVSGTWYELEGIKIKNGTPLMMLERQLELVPEPKNKFKVGDFVKGTDRYDYPITNGDMTKGEVVGIRGFNRIDVKVLEHSKKPHVVGVTIPCNADYVDLLEEPKVEFKVGDTVRIKLNAKELQPNNWSFYMDKYLGKIGEVVGVGEGYFRVSVDREMSWSYKPETLELVKLPEPKYPIIEYEDNFKIVYNPPYTIVRYTSPMTGKIYEGKAICNSTDTYTRKEGRKWAQGRLKEI